MNLRDAQQHVCKYEYMQHMYNVYAAHLKNLKNHLSRLVSTPVGLTDLCEDENLNNFYDNCFDFNDLKQPSLSPWKPPRVGEIWEPRPNVV